MLHAATGCLSDHPLNPELVVEEAEQLGKVEHVQMIGIGIAPGFVNPLIGHGADEAATRRQDTRRFRHERTRILDVLQRLE